MKKKIFSSFQKKIFMSYIGIIGVGLSALYFMLFTMLIQIDLQSTSRNQIGMAIKLTQQMENYLTDMRDLGLQVMSDARIIRDFSEFQDEKDQSNFYIDHIIKRINTHSVLSGINGIHRNSIRISIYNQYGDYISTGTHSGSESFIQHSLDEQIDRGILKDLQVHSEKIIFEGPHDDRWNEQLDIAIISMYCPIGYAKNIYGVAEVQQDVNKLKKNLEGGLVGGLELILYDGRGNVILSTLDTLDSELKNDIYNNFVCDTSTSSFDFKNYSFLPENQYKNRMVLYDKYFLTLGKSEVSDWSLVMLQKQNQLVSNNLPGFLIVFFITLIALAGALYAAFLHSSKISRPVRKMREALLNVSWGRNMELLNMEVGWDDEIVMLGKAFELTMERLQKSMDLEIRSTLKALQSQMNPHFIYNVLAVVGASADEPEKVEQMCVNLSDMFRYVAVYDDENTVTLLDELWHTQNYLKLMKMRFEDKLEYDIATIGPLDQIIIPRVILQPIVENCFKHGFDEIVKKWEILIRIEVYEKVWTIWVENNGKEFNKEDKTKLDNGVKEFLNGSNQNSYGIGLMNTIIRLKLLYQEEIDYQIFTLDNGHVVVMIKREGKADD